MKRYRDFNGYLKEKFGERVQKISLDAGFSCPNRDGTVSDKGCIYCDSRGSGTGALINNGLSIDEQILQGQKFANKRYGAKKYIAYFQSYTNTYGPTDQLKDLYDKALAHPGMVGLSVGTRPDCVNNEILDLIASYKEKYMVWVEYGLQSSNDQTLLRINRGHDAACFAEAVKGTRARCLNVCAHIILGLPGEDREMMLETAGFIANLPVNGVKIHLMYIVKGTRLASLYEKGDYKCLERDEYVNLVIDFLELIPEEVVIQRLTGDPPVRELIAPQWAIEKTRNLNLILKKMEERESWQGKKIMKFTAGKLNGAS